MGSRKQESVRVTKPSRFTAREVDRLWVSTGTPRYDHSRECPTSVWCDPLTVGFCAVTTNTMCTIQGHCGPALHRASSASIQFPFLQGQTQAGSVRALSWGDKGERKTPRVDFWIRHNGSQASPVWVTRATPDRPQLRSNRWGRACDSSECKELGECKDFLRKENLKTDLKAWT